jgi:hypothetical protein
MTKEFLLETAQKLKQPTKEATKEFTDKSDALVDQMNVYMLARDDIKGLVGENNFEMMKDNHANHARFMESIFSQLDYNVLVDTVLWVFRAYRSHGFSSNYWAAQLNGWMKIFKEALSKKCYKEIIPFYKWMQVNIAVFDALAEEKIDSTFSRH